MGPKGLSYCYTMAETIFATGIVLTFWPYLAYDCYSNCNYAELAVMQLEKSFLKPTLRSERPCQCFDWLLQSSSGRKWWNLCIKHSSWHGISWHLHINSHKDIMHLVPSEYTTSQSVYIVVFVQHSPLPLVLWKMPTQLLVNSSTWHHIICVC